MQAFTKASPRWPALLGVVTVHIVAMDFLFGGDDVSSLPLKTELPALSAALLSLPVSAVSVPATPAQATKALSSPSPQLWPAERLAKMPTADPVVNEQALSVLNKSEPMVSPVAEPASAKAAEEAVVLPRVDVLGLQNSVPAYPQLSTRLGEAGNVTLLLLIGADGSVEEIKLERSSGFSRLDRAAIEAVKRWRFIPARQGGQAISYWYSQLVSFSLKP